MTITFREDTSFPFLKIAREHNVPYGVVLALAGEIDAIPIIYRYSESPLTIAIKEVLVRLWRIPPDPDPDPVD